MHTNGRFRRGRTLKRVLVNGEIWSTPVGSSWDEAVIRDHVREDRVSDRPDVHARGKVDREETEAGPVAEWRLTS